MTASKIFFIVKRHHAPTKSKRVLNERRQREKVIVCRPFTFMSFFSSLLRAWGFRNMAKCKDIPSCDGFKKKHVHSLVLVSRWRLLIHLASTISNLWYHERIFGRWLWVGKSSRTTSPHCYAFHGTTIERRCAGFQKDRLFHHRMDRLPCPPRIGTMLSEMEIPLELKKSVFQDCLSSATIQKYADIIAHVERWVILYQKSMNLPLCR